MRWSSGLATGLVAALTGAPAPSVHAKPAKPTWVLAGQTAAGSVRAVAPRKLTTYLAFAAQVEVGQAGRLRVVLVSCTGSVCITEDRTLPGTLTVNGGRATLGVTHPKLGRIRLTGTIGPGVPDYQQCHSEWGTSGKTLRTFDYDAVGMDHRTRWSGRIGAKTVLTGGPGGCGVYQSAGVLLAE